MDSTLKGMVSDFASGFSYDSFLDAGSMNSAITDIMYQWAGVQDVDPASRGPTIDARTLEFIEHLLGEPFVSPLYGPQPYWRSGPDLQHIFDTALEHIKTDLMIQSGGQALFANPVTYEPWSGTITGALSLSHTAIEDLATHAPSPGPDNANFWIAVTDFLDQTAGLDSLSSTENGWMDSAIVSTDSSLSWSLVEDLYHGVNPGSTTTATSGDDTLSGTTGSDLIYGLAGNDTLYGCGGDDLIYGGDGNDVICLGGSGTSVVHGDGGNDTIIATAGTNDLYGDDGNDIIWGGSGDNILHGGAGGNILHGNEGDDTYVYTAGAADLIEESSTGGSDQSILPSGITSDDVTFSRVSTGDSTSYFYDLLISFS